MTKPLQDFFENLALEWDCSQPFDREDTINTLLHQFDETLSKSRKILDAGTGTGALIPILSQRYPKSRIFSIDFAHQMCLRASKRKSTASVAQCDVHTLPFGNHSFDTVICHNSFPHFYNKMIALKSLKRTLKPHGKLLILHDISRDRVNEIHENAQAKVIRQDLLPEASRLVNWLDKLGFSLEIVDDTDSNYIIYAKLR